MPEEAVAELVENNLAKVVPGVRGPLLETVMEIGTDAAVLVTLLQTPDTVRAFAAWVLGWGKRQPDGMVVHARKKGRRVDLRVEGEVSIDTITDFISDALR